MASSLTCEGHNNRCKDVVTTLARRCPETVKLGCEVSEEDESTCYSNKHCSKEQLCCTVGCIKECVDPVRNTTPSFTGKTAVKPPVRRPVRKPVRKPVRRPARRPFPKNARICYKQSHCRRHQCCTNPKPGAKIGLCMNRRRIAYRCHNPRRTGAYHVWCPGPAGIIHPDLCPCGCGDFCAMGPSPRRHAHGGYIGICSFG
ncbi:uncharacterized protein LOC121370078 [Gigantopelta aegis]|uniref:uncharacterized protein LOC121370078 n=1 Tax=Gigantopelta aegis TaxID=1735272 RepID=UPI001B88CE32|nr:uncharacterized protein LOC121370078 [Gigantopelta aegis]